MVATSTSGNGGGGNSGEDTSTWSREWRAQISREVESSAEKHERAAVIQERILGMLNQHDGRIAALEQRPDKLRADLGTYGGCSSQVFYIGLGALNLLIALTGTAIAIISLVHHP